jgi:hypothetical protein
MWQEIPTTPNAFMNNATPLKISFYRTVRNSHYTEALIMDSFVSQTQGRTSCTQAFLCTFYK